MAVVAQTDHDVGQAGHACGVCAGCCVMHALPCVLASQQGICHTGTYSLTDAGALPAPAIHRLERPPRRVLV